MAIHNSTADLDSSADIRVLCKRVAALKERFPPSTGHRILIALAGVPGSGKSTISAAFTRWLREQEGENVVVLPMDGYHLPKSVLSTLDNPERAFRRRGAPFTYDAEAFVKLVATLRATPVTASDEPQLALRVPSFDHFIQDPVQGDICVSSSDRIVILEGNYLLLDEKPWNMIANLVDEKWFVDIPAETALQRLVERHIRAGIEHTMEAATARVIENDLQNGDLIRAKLIKPDVRIEN